MKISHLKLTLNQDCDMDDVKQIVASYEGAKLDENNYIVYYNTCPEKVVDLLERLYPYRYGAEVTNETF